MRTILAVNCGSSSIKFKLFSSPDLNVLIYGQASAVASKGQKPVIKFTVNDNDKSETRSEEDDEQMSYEDVFRRIIVLLEESSSQHFQDAAAADVITAVSHRVVHGGTETEPMDIYKGHTEQLEKLDELSSFAPLHNHRAVEVVKYCLEHLPNSYQVLCFDTLFHATLPPRIYTYPLADPKEPPPIPLRKYGAHGLSYAYILAQMSKHLQKPKEELNLIVAHLGSGASVCLIKDGKSLDTSMGLTPLEGLPGGTRTGSIDPALIFHYTPNASERVDFNGFPVAKGEMILNKEGGVQAIAGTSNFGTITAQLDSNPKFRLAYDVFLDRVLNFLGAYLFKLFGLGGECHGIVFSGGIGEKASKLRADVGANLGWLGCTIDNQANNASVEAPVTEVSEKESRLKVFVCLTDEEVQTASMALDVIRKRRKVD